MDWADKLVTKMHNRGDYLQNAAQLRDEVQKTCKSNIKRWKGEEWNTPKERIAATKKETKRLIELKQDEDKRDQLKFDYKQKGISIEPDHSQYGKIASVRLPFSSNEWADLLNGEGKLLEYCCVDISRIRDILQEACRNDHFIEIEDLYEAHYLAKHHGFKKNVDHPISVMMDLWEKVKNDARQRSNGLSANLDDPQDALKVLYHSSEVISWDNLFSKRDDGKNAVFDRHVNRNYALATAQVAVRTLFFKIKEMDPGAIEGYGLVRSNGKVGHTRRGLAIFRTEELAREICENWNKQEKDSYSVKKVRVTMEKGFEILPKDHEIQITDNVKNTPEPEEIEF